ncbi:hypothetical protein [Alteromonas sp. CyTr2]|jgi:hypothetical protein|uniref:hypothetical protein n=1 Tax=Alteromonas sp. CyTr2 TaxID=2935039 RepID=UPI00248EA437|nr:hypothetical protein [Alteromonas sp. CyTr2]
MSYIQDNIQMICDNAVRIRDTQPLHKVEPIAKYYGRAFHDAITLLTQLAFADSAGDRINEVFSPGEIAREATAAIQLINDYQHLALQIDSNIATKTELLNEN